MRHIRHHGVPFWVVVMLLYVTLRVLLAFDQVFNSLTNVLK